MLAHCPAVPPAFGDARLSQIHFLIDSHNLLPVDAHGFDAHYLVSDKAHKVHIRGRSAVDPLFIINVAILLADSASGRPLA